MYRQIRIYQKIFEIILKETQKIASISQNAVIAANLDQKIQELLLSYL